MDTKNTKPIKNKAAQALAKLRHQKSPKPPEFYKEIGRLGAKKRWEEKEQPLDN